MTDTTATPAEPPVDADQPPVVDETDWKAKARQWETRAKENAGAARRLAELEEASKSDLQKAIDRAETAERRIAEVELSAARAEIAATSGVPLEALRGSNREELEAHAETLKALLTAQPRGPVVSNPGGIPANAGGGDERAFARALFGNH
jgi:ATP-dependent Clp protease ATP-binding subunit ClpA